MTACTTGSGWTARDCWPRSSPVRAELMTGDLRLLYLAWLLAVQSGEVDQDEVEPPVPPGLGRLSAAASAVARFLRIDSELIAVAAERSASAGTDDTLTELPDWLARLPAERKDVLLLRVARGGGGQGARGAAGRLPSGDIADPERRRRLPDGRGVARAVAEAPRGAAA